MPPGSILGESDDSYVYNDGSGNVAVVPKSSLDPDSGIVGVWNAAKPQAPMPDATPQPVAPAPAPPPMAMLPDAPRGTGVASVAPMPQPTPLAVNAALPPQPAPIQKPQTPMTPEQLQRSSLQQGAQALDDEAAADVQKAKIESDAAKDKASTLDKRNQAVDMYQLAADQQRVVDQQQQAKKQQEWMRAVDAKENYNVDQNAYYHDMGTGQKMGMFVMAAIAGLGQVLDHKDPTKNPVLQMMEAENVKAVNAQLDKRAQLGERAARLKGDLTDFKADSASRQAEFNKQMAIAQERTARQLEQAAAHYADPAAKVNGMQAAAQARLAKAKYVEQGATQEWQQDNTKKQQQIQQQQHRESLGVQYAQLGETKRKNQVDEKLARDQFDFTKVKENDDKMLRAAALKNPDPAAQKAALEQGVGGITVDGTPDGQLLVAPTKEEAVKLRSQKAGVDTVNRFINDMARGIKENGGASKWLQSPQYQQTIAKKESLLFALHAAYGVEGFRPGVLEQMEKALGGTDPASFFRDATPGLMAAKDALNEQFTNQLRVADPRFKGDYAPADTSQVKTDPNSVNQAAVDIQTDQTPTEEEASYGGRGTVGKALNYVTGAGLIRNGDEEHAQNAANSGSSKYAGLGKDQEHAMDTLLTAYNGTGASKADAVKRLVEMATAPKGSLGTATLGVLRNEAPEVYKKALAAMPKEQRAAAESMDKTLAVVNKDPSTAPIRDVAIAALRQDPAALAELNKRGAAGDPEAMAMIAKIKEAMGGRGATP